jgi:ribosome-associated protein
LAPISLTLDCINRRQNIPSTTHPQNTADRTEAARQFAIEAARLAANTRCHNVVVMDVRGISPITDYLVIATGTSARQMSTVMSDLEEFGHGRGFACLSRNGYEGDTWLLCDMVDVVVHLFNQESRLFYDLDSLWGDAKRVDWKPAEVQQSA